MLSHLPVSFHSPLVTSNCRVFFFRTIKFFPPPPDYSNIVLPEKRRLPVLPKVPQYIGLTKAPKMPKRLIDMRGPEPIHNELVHRQYGIVAVGGGMLRPRHIEVIRSGLNRYLDLKRMFLEWRIPAPWKPLTKKGQGKRMGGGKGSIKEYGVPVKPDRIIVELAGHCEFEEVLRRLTTVANKLPFAARAISFDQLEQEAKEARWREKNNKNKYTYEYHIRNNIQNCHQWCSPYDQMWFGKYL